MARILEMPSPGPRAYSLLFRRGTGCYEVHDFHCRCQQMDTEEIVMNEEADSAEAMRLFAEEELHAPAKVAACARPRAKVLAQ